MKVLFVFMFFIGFYSVNVTAEIFKWVDSNGRVHYDDKPPLKDKNKKKVMNINEENNAVRGLSNNRLEKRKKLLGAIDEDRKLRKKQADKEKKKKLKLKKQCIRAKDRLRSYRQSTSVYKLDQNGKRVTMPSSVRDRVINSLQNKIKENCSK